MPFPQRRDYNITVGTAFDVGPMAVPTSNTAVKSADCRVYEFQICNTTAGDVNITITDGNDLAFIPTTIVPASGGTVSFSSPRGRSMPAGIKWQASGAGLVGFITGIT